MMNLDNFFSEGDISKFDKMNDNEVYSMSEFDTDSMNFQHKEAKSKKEVIADENKKICIKTAKRLQNLGKTSSEIKSYIKERFATSFIPEGLDETLDKEEGIFGVVLVDCSSFDNKSEYDKLPMGIKNKHQYAIKCACKDKYTFNNSKTSKVSGDINAFISEQDDFEEMPIATVVCPKTGLPVLNQVKDYTDEDSIKHLNQLEENREITSDEKKEILKIAISPLSCAKKAFKLINYKPDTTNKTVDNFNKFSLGKNVTSVKLSKKAKVNLKLSNLSVAPINPEIGERKDNNVAININTKKDIPIEYCNPIKKNIEISDFHEPEMTLNKTDIKKDIPVEVKHEIEIPVILEKKIEIIPEIERGFLVDEEWFENEDSQKQDLEVDNKFEEFSIDGNSQLLI